MLEVSDALFESNQKKTILEKIDQVPMSNQTITRRTEVLANDCFEKLKSDLGGAQCFSVALDEITDIKDIAQLCIFVRYFNGSIFVEDLLTKIPLYDRTRGEDIYDAVTGFFRDQNLDIARLVSITTDGAPAMIAPRKGFVSRLKCDHPQMLSYHCIIHQGALCAKLSNIMQAAMTQIMKTVNFLRAKSALQHRQLRTFLEEQDAEYGDLLLHCDVRWLSKGAVLNRFWAVRLDIKQFLSEKRDSSEAKKYLDFLEDHDQMCVVAFLADLMGHFNTLNLSLQGKGKTIVELFETIMAFQNKLKLFIRDISNRMNHFTTLRDYIDDTKVQPDTNLFVDFLKSVVKEFGDRFQDKIDGDIALFVINPFLVSVDGDLITQANRYFPWTKEVVAELEI